MAMLRQRAAAMGMVRAAGRGYARVMSTKPLKSGEWIEKDLGYDT
jgi:hypothetical protein